MLPCKHSHSGDFVPVLFAVVCVVCHKPLSRDFLSSTSRPKVTEIACLTRPKLCATFQLLWDIIWCRGWLCVCSNGKEHMRLKVWCWSIGLLLGKTGGTHQRYISLASRAVGPTYVWRRKLMHKQGPLSFDLGQRVIVRAQREIF